MNSALSGWRGRRSWGRRREGGRGRGRGKRLHSEPRAIYLGCFTVEQIVMIPPIQQRVLHNQTYCLSFPWVLLVDIVSFSLHCSVPTARIHQNTLALDPRGQDPMALFIFCWKKITIFTLYSLKTIILLEHYKILDYVFKEKIRLYIVYMLYFNNEYIYRNLKFLLNSFL